MFELELPQEIQNHIFATERSLWAELDNKKLREECKKVEEWIMDPGHTMGHTSLYEKMVALFWVMKNLVGRAAWDHQSNDSGGPSLDPWKASISTLIQCVEDSVQHAEASVQHVEAKVDFLISCLGFQYPSPSILGATKPDFPITTQGSDQDLSYILL